MQTIAVSVAFEKCDFQAKKSWYLSIIFLILNDKGVSKPQTPGVTEDSSTKKSGLYD